MQQAHHSEDSPPMLAPHDTLSSSSPESGNAASRLEPGKADDDLVHLLICTNALFLQHAAVCLTSILVNNPDLFFDVVVVGRPSETLNREKLRRSLARFTNHSLSFREFAPPAKLLLPLNPRAHYTLDNWLRLWVADFFPAEVARVLYLDSDLVVLGNIAPLWRADLEGQLLGAIDIPGAERGVVHLGLQPEDGYFNSGVLLFDLQRWRESHALDEVLDYVEAHPELMTRDVDQEALNACFHDRRKRLDYRWNAVTLFFQDTVPLPLPLSEVEAVRQEARVIHFNGPSKPWSYFCSHARKAEYEKYLRMTEWRDFVPADRTAANRLRKLASAILPARAKALLKAVIR
jgi:lipopolysaccharide biosynthesis glycosyltransferase